MRKAIPLILLAAGAAYFYSQFNTFSTGLKAKISGVKFNLKESQRSLFTRIILDVNLVVSNPSRVQGIIEGAKINALVNDKVVGMVDQYGSIPIAAQGSSTIPLKVTLNTLAVVPTIANLISIIGKGMVQTLIIRGDLKTNVGVVNINEKVSVVI